ncbi:MAG: response regulator [Anaerolineales bacterium]|nr:response regulator [Anaerolineales bacterium]
MNDKPTILVVDDHPAVRMIITRVLSPQGYEIITATNGHEALVLANEIKPDLILLDVMMPDGLNGFEVCRRLRQNPILHDVPIVMVTALDDRASRLEGIESGADDFIIKPFDPVELRARVANITRLNRYRRLLAERLKFEWVVEDANEGYAVLDAQGSIVHVNNRARIYLNLPPKWEAHTQRLSFIERIGQLYNLEPEESWQDWPQFLGKQDGAMRYMIRPETANAAAFWLQFTGLKLPMGEGDQLYVVRLNDVTQQMTVKHDVWQLHSMIFHKLRTPFTSIMMSLEMLEQHAADLPPEETRLLQHTAAIQARRLNEFIDSMLKYVNSTALVPLNDSFHIHVLPDLLEQLREELALEIINYELEPGLMFDSVMLSEESINMMLWEIIRNAKQFHPRNQPQVEVQVHKPNDTEIIVRIIDDGVHLSPDQLIAVWQPYYQGEKDFTGEVPGAGLGLTAVALMAWQVGGKYRIYNRPDHDGVVVELTLPLRTD